MACVASPSSSTIAYIWNNHHHREPHSFVGVDTVHENLLFVPLPYTRTHQHTQANNMNDESKNNPLICQGRTKLQDRDGLVRGQAICQTVEQAQPGSLTTASTATTIWSFGLDWYGSPIFYRQSVSSEGGNDASSESTLTVLWQETTVTGDYLELDGTTGRLVLRTDDDDENQDADRTTMDEPPAAQSRPVWSIGGCGELDGTNLALYQLTITSSDPPQVNLGIGSQGTLWSLNAQGQVVRDVCPPLDDLVMPTTSTNSTPNDDLDNDGLRAGGMAGVVLGAAVVGMLLGMWVRQYYPSWCTIPSYFSAADEKDEEKDPQRRDLTNNSSSTTSGSPVRQEPAKVTL